MYSQNIAALRVDQSRRHAGRAGAAIVAFLASAGLLAVLVVLLASNPEGKITNTGSQPLVVFCAAAVKAPLEAIARDYEKAYGVPVQLQFGASQTLLTNIQVSGQGDLFLPADDSYLDLAREKNLIDESIPLAKMTAVLVVAKGNPKKLNTLDDLTREEVRLVQANPDSAAIGKLTRDALVKQNHWDALAKQTLSFKPTVHDVANDVKVGTVDAGIVWDATAQQYPELDIVTMPELANATASVSIAVVHTGTQHTAALRFARFVAARDKGLPEFAQRGYEIQTGDIWAETPEISLFSGAMLRPAIEETITAFEKREGVRVTRVYNGCGILVSQMRAGEVPDAFFACDKSFMDDVHDLFLDSVDVSTNQLVILVPKGNPRKIKSLDDLGGPGLRVGIGHEKQCALGVLTQRTLVEGKMQQTVMKNVVVQTPTGDMLVNQMRAGSLDAAVAYVSNAATAGKDLDAIRIDGLPCAIAIQPMAAGKETRHPQLTARLMAALRSATSRVRFEATGFHWREAAP